jgi:hypothetical protein
MGTVKNPGLIRNVGNYLFDFVDRSYADALNNGFDMKSIVTISCLEIYNEQIRVKLFLSASICATYFQQMLNNDFQTHKETYKSYNFCFWTKL